ncbi:LuxR family transcriptional regulator [Amycolatopsis minnesotensis]|uniref:helix-turn-helix transcriptional regulator n=1 Tax=Amycolatopsis minnesotensis TaxID=337894 RepID=UPI0031D4A6DD
MTARIVDRHAVEAAVAAALDERGRVVVTGFPGAGKTTALRRATERGAARVVWLAPAPAERELPLAGIAEVVLAVREHVDRLPPAQAAAVAALLRTTEPPAGGIDPLAVRLALLALLSAVEPVTIVVDDAAMLDLDSAAVLSFLARRMPRLRVALAGAGADDAGELGEDAEVVEVPVFDAEETACLLGAGELSPRQVTRIHRLSGGFPRLACDLAAAPDAVPARARRWLARVDDEVRQTLLTAALATRPTARLVRRAGRDRADADLAVAAAAGLVRPGTDEVVFTAGIVPLALRERAGWEAVAACHARLADVDDDPVEQARHRALATEEPSAALAEEAAAAAELSRRRHDRACAAELAMLAADRTPPGMARVRVDRMVAAAEYAGRAGNRELAANAASAVLAAEHEPSAAVRVRLAMVDAAGQSIEDCAELLAAAADAAGDDPALRAAVMVRDAVKANLADGDPELARDHAARAAVLAAESGARSVEMTALTMRARIEWTLCDPCYPRSLAAALAMDDGATRDLHDSARFLAARHAFFEDRLTDAESMLVALLPEAERAGATDLVEVTRSLAEVQARAGRCADAIVSANRALAVTTGLELSPGPSWYTAAVAELHGGSFAHARDYADRGARASRHEHDAIYLSRNLHVVGLVDLVTGRSERALTALRAVRNIESAHGARNPSLLRWHGDCAEALAATGQVDDALALIDDTAATTRCQTVLAALDRARASCLSATGEIGAAADLLADVAERFDGQPVERGRTLLAIARARRRQRRWAAARAAVATATELFAAAGAQPWQRLALIAIGGDGGSTGPTALTPAEERLADLVARGISNRQAADRLHLSVKTVEAMLTRIYRKLAVTSRAQLATTRTGRR